MCSGRLEVRVGVNELTNVTNNVNLMAGSLSKMAGHGGVTTFAIKPV